MDLLCFGGAVNRVAPDATAYVHRSAQFYPRDTRCMTVTWWGDVVAEEPDFARRVRQRFTACKHITMATLRKDGSPRISGTGVRFTDTDIYLGSMAGAVKALDLRRDGRVALHSPTEDTPEDDPSSWVGDAKVSGIAHEVEPYSFRIAVLEAVLIRVGTPADHLLIETWHPGSGLRLIRR